MEQGTEVVGAIPRFIVSGGDKGGVGKTMTSRAIADYLHTLGVKVAVLEADTSNPDVFRMFNDCVPCQQVDLSEEDGWMDMIDFVDAHPGFTFVLNTPAGVGKSFKKYLPMLHAYLYEKEIPNAELELWWTLDIVEDCVNLLLAAHADYGHLFSRVRVLRNSFRGTANSYFFFNENLKCRQMIKNGGLVIDLPALHQRVIQKISATGVIPYGSVLDVSVGESCGLAKSELIALSEWLKIIATRFAVAFALAPELSSATASTGGKNK